MEVTYMREEHLGRLEVEGLKTVQTLLDFWGATCFAVNVSPSAAQIKGAAAARDSSAEGREVPDSDGEGEERAYDEGEREMVVEEQEGVDGEGESEGGESGQAEDVEESVPSVNEEDAGAAGNDVALLSPLHSEDPTPVSSRNTSSDSLPQDSSSLPSDDPATHADHVEPAGPRETESMDDPATAAAVDAEPAALRETESTDDPATRGEDAEPTAAQRKTESHDDPATAAAGDAEPSALRKTDSTDDPATREEDVEPAAALRKTESTASRPSSSPVSRAGTRPGSRENLTRLSAADAKEALLPVLPPLPSAAVHHASRTSSASSATRDRTPEWKWHARTVKGGRRARRQRVSEEREMDKDVATFLAVWSQPTSKQPVPRATARVWFTYRLARDWEEGVGLGNV
ncbi:hypothetical protein BDK51DRAFT_48462 [Blyttiomyces helicus]|uniref:Uncharacterized protein n=1 Tax=Blyttiomyces helicus TaxID=388810 RepID=A0A4P9W2G5_9FUNG|nr:hypothetical protein BDK51DRAFT_48462 [Blyttiomyces helicus]|eukprot:RKO84978.1 hypothetical protein BDK51DRAFT_48462 [Blyttiomyces helicus]